MMVAGELALAGIAPGCESPRMQTVSVTSGSPDSGLMVWGPFPAMLKSIVSVPAAVFASRIACRRDPAPLSFVFVTVKTVREYESALGNATAISKQTKKHKPFDFMMYHSFFVS